MNLPADRRLIIGAVAGLAVVAVVFMLLSGGKSEGPAVRSEGGLKVEIGKDDKIEPGRQLPCYVNGQSVGMSTLADCARRNGVETGQISTGIDQSGALAYGQASLELAPLPPKAQDDEPFIVVGPPSKAAV